MTEIHKAAQRGYSIVAQTYAQGRPEYPSGILLWLKDNLGVTTGKLVVDLGAGTGKFTRLLAQTGANIVSYRARGGDVFAT